MDAQIGFLLPALRDDRLRAYARVMQEEAEAYFERWGDRGEADLLVAMNELTVFIASRCLVGGDFRRAVTEEFARLYHDLEGSVNLLTFLQPRLPLPVRAPAGPGAGPHDRPHRAGRRGAAGARSGGRGLPRRAHARPVSRRADARRGRDHGSPAGDRVRGPAHERRPARRGRASLLLEHEAHLAAVLRRAGDVFGAGREMTIETLRQLAVLERCIKEAERMHPPLILLMRRVLRELVVGDHVVPAGRHCAGLAGRGPPHPRGLQGPRPLRSRSVRARTPGGPQAPARADRIRRRPPSLHRVDLRLSAGQGDLVRAPPAVRALARPPRPRPGLLDVRAGTSRALPRAVPAAARPAVARRPRGPPWERGRDDHACPRSRTRATCARRSGRPGSTPITGTPWSTTGRSGQGKWSRPRFWGQPIAVYRGTDGRCARSRTAAPTASSSCRSAR